MDFVLNNNSNNSSKAGANKLEKVWVSVKVRLMMLLKMWVIRYNLKSK